MDGAAHVIFVVHAFHVNLVSLAPSRRQGARHHKPVSTVLKAWVSFDYHDALDPKMVPAAKALTVMHFLHAVMVFELLVAEMSFVPPVILVPVSIFVVTIGVSMPMPRIFVVLMPVAVSIVIVMLGKSGHARGHPQCQNCGKAYSNQSHRCVSTAK